MWTKFMDMHSGGDSKESWEYIYIEAAKKEAQVIFYNRFGHNPERVTCTCCGEDYSVSEYETLEKASAYQRDCRWDKKHHGYTEEDDPEKSYTTYRTLEEYKQDETILVINENEIKTEEKTGNVPKEGYVWV